MSLYGHDVKNRDLVVEAQIKSIVMTVFTNCKKESDNNSLLIPLEDYDDRAAYFTGLEKESLYKLLENPIENTEQTYDVAERVIIMKALVQFYKNKQYPDFKNLYQAVHDVFPVSDVAAFRRVVTLMGFDYKKTINGKMIVEDQQQAFERFHYLKNLKRLRSTKVPVVYLEERYIDKLFTFRKPDLNKEALFNSDDKDHVCEGFYLYHVLGDAGLITYFITNKICKIEYDKWVFGNMIQLLKPGCAIIIDNHPLHGDLADETITQYHSKADMLNWLRKRNIACSNNMYKPELYDLISKCNKPMSSHKFDKLLKAHGHEVLRVPNACNLLSPTSPLWMEVAKEMPKLNPDFSVSGIEKCIIPTISSTHEATWKLIKHKNFLCEEILDSLSFDTEMALENFEPFDVKNVNRPSNIPEYFYVLDGY